MVAVFLSCGLAAGADALPVAATGQTTATMVQPAAHEPKEWYWSGHWWRPTPWSGHFIHGAVNPRGPGVLFIPWGEERLRYCAEKYRSFDPATGTYVTWRGERRVCH